MAHLRSCQIRSSERRCIGCTMRKAEYGVEVVLREDLCDRGFVPSSAVFVSMVSVGGRRRGVGVGRGFGWLVGSFSTLR